MIQGEGKEAENWMSVAVLEAPPLGSKRGIRAVAAASVGNLLEWYDFTIYAFFAIYIGQNFLPGDDPDLNLIKSFLVYGFGFVARPLGAVIIGVYGDRAGRKAALTLTIMIMAAGTALIAFTPNYAAIGLGAPIVLVAGRLLQGFSAGGEVGGAAAFLVENAPAGKRGLFASWLQASMGMSNILGALIGIAVTGLFSQADVAAFGWRIPFLVGLLIAPVGLYLRRTLEETPEFQIEMARRRGAQRGAAGPLRTVFRDHWRALLKGFGLCVLWAVGPYSLIIPIPAYAQHTLGYTAGDSYAAALISDVVLVFACFGAGALSDRLGRKPVLSGAALALLLTVWPLFLWLQASHGLATLTLVQCAFCLMAGFYVGVAPAALSELFETPIRATGMAISYTTAVVGLGAFAPAILTWLSRLLNGSSLATAGYVMAASLLALIAIRFLPKRGAS
jgi:MHS family proline/betaine transporter-like MFS transporter